MSFLRTFRSNLILSTAPPANDRALRNGTSNGTKASMKTSSSGSRKHSAGGRGATEHDGNVSERVQGGRRGSAVTQQSRTGGKHSSSSSGGDRYGKENPAPIVVYLDKQQQQQHNEGKKQPTSILRTNTFTKHDDDEHEQRARHAITRSDTFTIQESSDETVFDSHTFTRHGTPAAPVTRDVFEPLYAKNIELSSHERLPVVVDSRTYRKKSLKSSKPVQKVESFIKRFERTLFSKAGSGGEGQKGRNHGSRKNSTATSEVGGTGGPRFRDVGINCKLDEEEKFRAKLEAMRRSRQDSRDSLVSQRDGERRRSQSPTKRLYERAATYDRRSSSSLSNGVVVLPLKEEEDHGSVTPSPPPEGGMGMRGSTLLRQTESSFLKNRQKEIEMGYSVVNKRQQPALSLAGGSPERGKVNSGSWRNARPSEEEFQPRERQYSNARGITDLTREDQNSLYGRYPFRTDTYRTLKEEYDEKQHLRQHAARQPKPVGIASPRMNEVRAGDRSPEPLVRRDSAPVELPKYTFGTEQLQQRRSRFQQFQKSFQKMDDSASEVSVQQSFFVPI
uniref:Uncharacterized protein n=1 Tax=Anopheles atroparvus TaxID=41427 RepID=A0AAG5D6T8_ANOAO